jgi:hypothetical protein
MGEYLARMHVRILGRPASIVRESLDDKTEAVEAERISQLQKESIS